MEKYDTDISKLDACFGCAVMSVMILGLATVLYLLFFI